MNLRFCTSTSRFSAEHGLMELSQIYGIKFREELGFVFSKISIFREPELTEIEQEYLQGYFEHLLIHLHEPRKKLLIAVYLRQGCLIHSKDFHSWSVSRNERGDVTHLVIESHFPPKSEKIEGYDFVTPLHGKFLYQINTLEIGTIQFKEKNHP
ncbi:MAG: hypothetical protein MRY57_03400 [Candidatus Pacebacteria bacterium]|nr:hypothetical protein [Candidatus Paceibacterota bacterium]